MFTQTGLAGDFLKLKETRALFRQEQHFPSSVIDRGLPQMNGGGILDRANQGVEELLSAYKRRPLPPDREEEIIAFAEREGQKFGLKRVGEILSRLPDFEGAPF